VSSRGRAPKTFTAAAADVPSIIDPSPTPPPPFPVLPAVLPSELGYSAGARVQVRSATKKAAGSTKNGRDSLPKHLGHKIADGQFAKTGALIYKQRGTRLLAGFGVTVGRGGNLHAALPGVVRFVRAGGRTAVRIDVSDEVAEAVTKRTPGTARPLLTATNVTSVYTGEVGDAPA